VCDVHVTVNRDKVLIIKQLDELISQIYFGNENLHVSDSSSVRHQDSAMVYVIQVCRQLASTIRVDPDPARKLSTYLYDIYHCCVYSEKLLMMDRGTVRNM
jgi:hypothetical protein